MKWAPHVQRHSPPRPNTSAFTMASFYSVVYSARFASHSVRIRSGFSEGQGTLMVGIGLVAGGVQWIDEGARFALTCAGSGSGVAQATTILVDEACELSPHTSPTMTRAILAPPTDDGSIGLA